MKNFLIANIPRIATYTSIIVFFTYNILYDREVACHCHKNGMYCIMYISVPVFIIFFLLLWKDKDFQSACRACCRTEKKGRNGKLCCLILFRMTKVFLISLLWVVSVLFDGDWYACCKEKSEEILQSCKTNTTLLDKSTADELKNESKMMSLVALLALILLVFILSVLKWCNCCRKGSSYVNGDVVYEMIIKKNKESILNKTVEEQARKDLTAKINQILEDKKNIYIDRYQLGQKVIDLLRLQENQGSSPGGDQSGPPPIAKGHIQTQEGMEMLARPSQNEDQRTNSSS